MNRMGHGSMPTALIYQHASTEPDRHTGPAEQGDDDDPEDGAA